MTVFFNVLLFLHMIGWAIVLGAALVGLRDGTLYRGAFHAVLTALVTGFLLVLVTFVWLKPDDEPSGAWVATKLIIGLVITGLVWLARARPARVNKALLGTIAALTVINVGIATIWH
jgi:hypothetical protein